MKTSDFTSLLKEPCAITDTQVKAIENVVDTYPYFQAAHVLYLKGLKKQSSYKYNNALKITAAHTTNRTVLFDFITSDALNVEKKESQDNENLLQNEVVDLEIIALNSDNKLEPKEQEKPILDSLGVGQPLEFNKYEKHSFNEWLQLTSTKPIERDSVSSKPKDEIKKEIEEDTNNENFALIERFLEKNPKIRPATSLEVIDISYESVSENENLMTETLARVYLEQKKYKKAIQAFKILSLKYPEKSGFFADRIRAVEFLQKNNS